MEGLERTEDAAVARREVGRREGFGQPRMRLISFFFGVGSLVLGAGAFSLEGSEAGLGLGRFRRSMMSMCSILAVGVGLDEGEGVDGGVRSEENSLRRCWGGRALVMVVQCLEAKRKRGAILSLALVWCKLRVIVEVMQETWLVLVISGAGLVWGSAQSGIEQTHATPKHQPTCPNIPHTEVTAVTDLVFIPRCLQH
jgi:hypothetical protein